LQTVQQEPVWGRISDESFTASHYYNRTARKWVSTFVGL